MRKPSYSVAHERENQRRRVLEEEEERERVREKLRRAIAEEKEEERKSREFMEKHYQTYDYTPLDPLQAQPKPQPGTKEDIMMKMMRMVVDGPPPTMRVIAKFGSTNYDITISKVEELEAVQAIVNKFINAFQPNPTQQSY